MESINKKISMIPIIWQGIKNKVLFLVLLSIQNIAIFWEHYFNNVGFPWDFMSAYFAWPAFWTTAVSMGIFPQWIPYQSMGYPMAMNPQSGLYYPIFWIFALLHIPYTLHTAVILQVIHILFGSIGMFFLLNSVFKSSRYAFIGAVAFQFFGGFYSNAEHADIIRAFALAPWLFYIFKLNTESPKVTRLMLFIPILIYFVATGAYPGNFVSTIFIIPVFLSLQLIDAYLRHSAGTRLLKIMGVLTGLFILGILISTVHLGPIWQGGNELTRFHDYSSQKFAGLKMQDFPTLFMSNRPLLGEISMKSIFVTLPMLIFASFVPLAAIKKYWVFIVVMIISFLMVAGPQSPFWQAVTSSIPALKLSRFPSSDYRVFVAIPIMILGIAGLRAIIERRLSGKEFLARAAFVVAWFSLGVFSLYSSVDYYLIQSSQLFVNLEITAAILILTATILLIIFYLRKNKSTRPAFANVASKSVLLSRSALIIIVILISADGLRVISDMQTWNERPFDKTYLRWNFPLEKNAKFITYSLFENIPNERPARETTDPIKDPYGNNLAWKGYLDGSYMMEDNGNTALLLAHSKAESNIAYRNYMLMKWTPILLDPNVTRSSESMRFSLPVTAIPFRLSHQSGLCSQFACDSAFSNNSTNNQVMQTHYGINDVVYHMTLKQPKLMVENELYFPGWEADLIFPDKKLKLEASEVNGVFRAWLLPAGDYKMIAHFQFPNLLVYQSISIVSFAIWIFITIRYWKRTSDKQMKNKEFLTEH
jgi:hypothetical protein